MKNVQNGQQNHSLIEHVKKQTFENQNSFPITFGTSGWRAIIGQEFTIYMVQKLTRAIVELYQRNDSSFHAWGIISWEELQQQGIVLGHDNRLFAKDFALAVHSVLEFYQIPVFYAGEVTTPELSAAVVQNNYAASINLTPSHNSAPYGGYKFNTKDGGPAEKEVTQKIEEICNVSNFQRVPLLLIEKWKKINCVQVYEKFVRQRKVLDLDFCISAAQKQTIALAVDPFYGSSKRQIWELLQKPSSLKVFHKENDCFFAGQEPEPNIHNLRDLKEYLDNQSNPLKVGGIMDPDGDRVLLYDGFAVISMNQFGVLAFHYLSQYRQQTGGIAKSVATSHFGEVMAKHVKKSCYETAIGFKNFRSYLKEDTREKALICFEESDGISAYNHTKEKDALFGYLLAVEITARLKKPLSKYLRELQEQVGTFYPLRNGLMIAVDKKAEMLHKIQHLTQEYCVGGFINFKEISLKIVKIDLTDGTKWILEDGSWFLIRPSGTEPKVRIYTESVKEKNSFGLLEGVKEWLT